MPELPEVETVVRGLRGTISGKTIARVRLFAPPRSIETSPSFGGLAFEKILAGRAILDIARRGKNILIQLSEDITLWVHLKMTGRMIYVDRSLPRDKHDLMLIDFENSPGLNDGMGVRFNDYRRFGRLRLYPDSELWSHPGLGDLGPEPLELTGDQFVEMCRRTRRAIKPALLDQTFIAGVGNIYADESLYASRIHPLRLTSSLSDRKLRELNGHIRRVLLRAIRKMGTSVDTYTGVNGEPGTFQKYLRVYGREGKRCGRCERTIVRMKVGARSAHFCPRCQRL